MIYWIIKKYSSEFRKLLQYRIRLLNIGKHCCTLPILQDILQYADERSEMELEKKCRKYSMNQFPFDLFSPKKILATTLAFHINRDQYEYSVNSSYQFGISYMKILRLIISDIYTINNELKPTYYSIAVLSLRLESALTRSHFFHDSLNSQFITIFRILKQFSKSFTNMLIWKLIMLFL